MTRSHSLHNALAAIAIGGGSEVQVLGSGRGSKDRRGCGSRLGHRLSRTEAGSIALLPGLTGSHHRLRDSLHGACNGMLHDPLGATLGIVVPAVVVAGILALEIGLLVTAAYRLGDVVIAAGAVLGGGCLAMRCLGLTASLSGIEITVVQVQIILLGVLTLVELLEKVLHVETLLLKEFYVNEIAYCTASSVSLINSPRPTRTIVAPSAAAGT